MSRRVVITGLGAVTGLGIGMEPLWEGLLAGRSALKKLQRFDPTGFPWTVAGEAAGYSAREYVPKHYRKAVKVMARDIELAVGAAKMAVDDAGLVTRSTLPEGSSSGMTYRPERMGCHVGAGLISAEADELFAAMATARTPDGRFDLRAWGERGMDNLTPLWLLKYLPNMLACHVTIIHGAEGPSNTITCAEASGLLSLGESTRVIQRGDADLCFCGGAESKVNFMGYLRMGFAGRLARTEPLPDASGVVRPFDPDAPGTVLGEAGGILILEELASATARGAKVYAEMVGFGASHSPPPAEVARAGEDEGYRFAVERALEEAGLGPGDIDAIVPHASGVVTLDAGEAGALRRVFGDGLGRIPLVTTAPSIGECMAGSGGVHAAVAARCLREQRLPARLHAGRPVEGLDAGPAPARERRLRHVLVATGALGGQNAAVILRATA